MLAAPSAARNKKNLVCTHLAKHLCFSRCTPETRGFWSTSHTYRSVLPVFVVRKISRSSLTNSPARQHISIAAPRLHGSGLGGLTCCDCRSTSRPVIHSPAELQARMVAATANPAGRIPCTYISVKSIIARFQLPA